MPAFAPPDRAPPPQPRPVYLGPNRERSHEPTTTPRTTRPELERPPALTSEAVGAAIAAAVSPRPPPAAPPAATAAPAPTIARGRDAFQPISEPLPRTPIPPRTETPQEEEERLWEVKWSEPSQTRSASPGPLMSGRTESEASLRYGHSVIDLTESGHSGCRQCIELKQVVEEQSATIRGLHRRLRFVTEGIDEETYHRTVLPLQEQVQRLKHRIRELEVSVSHQTSSPVSVACSVATSSTTPCTTHTHGPQLSPSPIAQESVHYHYLVGMDQQLDYSPPTTRELVVGGEYPTELTKRVLENAARKQEAQEQEPPAQPPKPSQPPLIQPPNPHHQSQSQSQSQSQTSHRPAHYQPQIHLQDAPEPPPCQPERKYNLVSSDHQESMQRKGLSSVTSSSASGSPQMGDVPAMACATMVVTKPSWQGPLDRNRKVTAQAKRVVERRREYSSRTASQHGPRHPSGSRGGSREHPSPPPHQGGHRHPDRAGSHHRSPRAPSPAHSQPSPPPVSHRKRGGGRSPKEASPPAKSWRESTTPVRARSSSPSLYNSPLAPRQERPESARGLVYDLPQ